MTLIFENAGQLRDVTCSYYANNDFERIERIIETVQMEVSAVIGDNTMKWITSGDGRTSDAWLACATAIGYMAVMRYSRLNDMSHEDEGRKLKMDRENEARPFEWQMARDERAHLEEYYRALDRLLYLLHDNPMFRTTRRWQLAQRLIIGDAATLSWLTGVSESPWLYFQLVPFMADSQHFVEKAFGTAFASANFQTIADEGSVEYAAQKAVALGAIALMGRRTTLQQLPYGLMSLFENDGGGNRREISSIARINEYLQHLSKEQHYWLNEMRVLRDRQSDQEAATYLQMPENDAHNKYIRL